MDLLEQINEWHDIIMVTTTRSCARAHRNVHIVDGQISDFQPYETRDSILKAVPAAPASLSPA